MWLKDLKRNDIEELYNSMLSNNYLLTEILEPVTRITLSLSFYMVICNP